MKRISSHRRFDLLNAVDRLVRTKGMRIREPTTVEAVFGELRQQFAHKQRDDIYIHGHRVQTLFAYVAASLGGCRVIKQEDAGELYSSSETVRIPDFRIVTREQRQFLVEVKNCHKADPAETLRFRDRYLSGLQEYADAFRCDLYIAIYWSRVKQWTLLTAADLDAQPSFSTITFLQAVKRNRMYELGDRMIGTTPAFVLRLVGDPNYGQATAIEGQYSFCIASAQLYCGQQLITDPTEQRIAWYLLNNGQWDVREAPAEFEGSRLAAVSLIIGPQERANPEQDFEIVGTLSELISRQFDSATTQDGEITGISPNAEPADFGVIIPDDFRSSALSLWQFDLRPADRHRDSQEIQGQ